MQHKRVHNRNGHLTRRVLTSYERASRTHVREGLAWYETAHTFALGLADRYDLTVRQTAGIVAALSPRLTWDFNQVAADLLCRTGDAPVMFGNKRKALAILHGADPDVVLGGNKVRSFWDNICSPAQSEAVTIDRHSVDLALGYVGDDASRKFLEAKAGYTTVSNAYRSAARQLDLRPLQVQAVTWLAWREAKTRKEAA